MGKRKDVNTALVSELTLPTEAIAESNGAEAVTESCGAKVKRTVKKLCKRWFIDAFTGMSQGLFVTLIAGTIIKQIGGWIAGTGTHAGYLIGNALTMVGSMASLLMGAGIGAGMAKMLKAPNLVIFSAIVAGLIGAFAMNFLNGAYYAGNAVGAVKTVALLPGNPIGAYVCALIAIEVGLKVAGKTKVDILLVPLVILITALICVYVAWPFIKFIDLISKGIEIATEAQAFIMGIVIAVCMGILLTMPTSSAAIWIAIATGVTSDSMLLAGGAAVAGCAAHMIGFAVASYRENGFGGLIAQGLGTSMLQIPNIMKNPRIMLPAIAASAVVGPLSTCVFVLKCNATGGGMGTSGLVGVFGVLEASSGLPSWQMWLGIALLLFVLPALISWGVSELLRKIGWIKPGDMKLDI